VLSLGVVIFDSSNFLAIGLAFFVLRIGIMLVMMVFWEGKRLRKTRLRPRDIQSTRGK